MSFLEKYLKEPFRYATSDWTKILIGSSLLFFIIFISLASSLLLGPYAMIFIIIPVLIVSMLLTGYYIGVIKNTLNGIDTLPDWSNYMEFTKDGILYYIALTIISLIVYLPAILFLIVGIFFTAGFEILTSGDLLSIIMSLSVFVIITVLYYMVASIALAIYTPLATVNFAKKGFSGFFEFFNILKKISLEYILMLILYFIVYSIVGVVSIIPFIGILIYGIISFPIDVIFHRAIAKYYLEKEME